MSITLTNEQVWPEFDGTATLIVKYVDSAPELQFNDGSGFVPFADESYSANTIRKVEDVPGVTWRVANKGNSVITLVAFKDGKQLS